jgi:hypothetical protein
MRAYSAGQRYSELSSEAFEASAQPSQWGSARHAQIAARFFALLRLFYGVAAEFFPSHWGRFVVCTLAC